MYKYLVLILSITLYSGLSYAENGCIENYAGLFVCSPPQGTIQKDYSGKFICGRGQCMEDYSYKLMCSNEDGGAIKKDYSGSLVCTGGECVQASASLCIEKSYEQTRQLKNSSSYGQPSYNSTSQSPGTPVYNSSECIGAVVNGKCVGTIQRDPNNVLRKKCYGAMINGVCNGAIGY